jgi:hypothetical protein
MTGFPFQLPKLLTQLISDGVWPGQAGPSMTEQQSKPLVPPDRVRLFAEDETLICLERPPFRTIADEMQHEGSGDFWEKYAAIDQITPERALIIGDFGMGSDSPIVLCFRENAVDPAVLRLKWGIRGEGNAWVEGAANFESFARLLGLVADT